MVKLGTLPVPGATVTARQGDKTFTVLTDTQGAYLFPDLADGTWTIKVEMRGFAPLEREVQSPGAAEWNLTILPMAKITEAGANRGSARGRGSEGADQAPAKCCRARGHQHNFGISARGSQRIRHSGGGGRGLRRRFAPRRRRIPGQRQREQRRQFALQPDSRLRQQPRARKVARTTATSGSSWTTRAWMRGRFRSPGRILRASPTTAFTGLATLGGPMRIPGLLRNGPQFTLNYQWTRNRNVATQSGLMPTLAERAGDFSQTLTPQGRPVQVIDPATGLPVPGNRIPLSRISPQAQALLSLYPLPNFTGQARYNFQVPIVSSLHQDSLQFRANRQLGRKNNLSGTLATAELAHRQSQSLRISGHRQPAHRRLHRQLASHTSVRNSS